MRLTPKPGCFGKDPKDLRPELHPEHRNAKDYRIEFRQDLVALQDNEQLAALAAKLAEESRPEIERKARSLAEDHEANVDFLRGEIAAARDAIGTVAFAFQGVITDRETCELSNKLQAEIDYWTYLLHQELILAERARNSEEYARTHKK